jgi:ABC-type phosphate transport system substrate-binding protein
VTRLAGKGDKMSRNRKAVVMAAVIVALVAATLAAASCGTRSGGTASQSQAVSVSNTGNPTIDGIVNDLDKQINSVSPDDFSDSQLNDSALGN